jgi:hypothetical protein
VLTAICLIGGGAGLLIWRRINATPPAPQKAQVSGKQVLGKQVLAEQVLAKTSAG